MNTSFSCRIYELTSHDYFIQLQLWDITKHDSDSFLDHKYTLWVTITHALYVTYFPHPNDTINSTSKHSRPIMTETDNFLIRVFVTIVGAYWADVFDVNFTSFHQLLYTGGLIMSVEPWQVESKQSDKEAIDRTCYWKYKGKGEPSLIYSRPMNVEINTHHLWFFSFYKEGLFLILVDLHKFQHVFITKHVHKNSVIIVKHWVQHGVINYYNTIACWYCTREFYWIPGDLKWNLYK